VKPGYAVGVALAVAVGAGESVTDGTMVGTAVGLAVGAPVATAVGTVVGATVGTAVAGPGVAVIARYEVYVKLVGLGGSRISGGVGVGALKLRFGYPAGMT
jgi:hypothetical protein